MTNQTETKTRKMDREKRRSGGWIGFGFIVVLIAAVIAAVLLFLGDG